jgi:5-methylcytosine-specific restriction endonuclease McrA
MPKRTGIGGLYSWSDVQSSVLNCPYLSQKDIFYLNNTQNPIAAWGGNRCSWFDGIRVQVYSRLNPEYVDVKGTKVMLMQCQRCGEILTYHGVQIDHITPWEFFIQQFTSSGELLSRLDAKILYNFPSNLRAICSICNASHPENAPIAMSTRGKISAYNQIQFEKRFNFQ